MVYADTSFLFSLVLHDANTAAAVAPIGPRYDICEHDWDFDTQVGWAHQTASHNLVVVNERLQGEGGFLPGSDRVRDAFHRGCQIAAKNQRKSLSRPEHPAVGQGQQPFVALGWIHP